MDIVSDRTVTADETKHQHRHRLPIHLNTRTFTSHLFFGPYIWLPIITGLVWLAGILALLGIWVHEGKPQYAPDQASVVYISNVAGKHKAVFIPITCVVTGFYIASLMAERWLRHVDRLPTGIRKREIIFNWLAVAFAVFAGAGLILLAVFDNYNHGRVHWSMTVVFVVCTSLSAIFQAGEVWSLHKDHPDRKSLMRNSIIKLCVIVLAVAGAVAFAVLYGVCRGNSTAYGSHSAKQCNRITSGAAAMEWTIAFMLVFFYLSLAGDLWPAGKSSPRYMRRLAKWQAKHEPSPLRDDFTGRGAFAAHPEVWETADVRAAQMEAEMKARNQGISYTPPRYGDSEGYSANEMEGSSHQLNARGDDHTFVWQDYERAQPDYQQTQPGYHPQPDYTQPHYQPTQQGFQNTPHPQAPLHNHALEADIGDSMHPHDATYARAL